MKRSSILRQQAKATGRKFYYTEMPCKRGHICARYTSTAKCTECSKYDLAASYKRDTKQLVARHMIYNARRRAEKLGVPFDLTREDVLRVWPPDNRCPVFGTLLTRHGGHPTKESATIDRLDPKLGYVSGNIAVLSLRANQIKAGEVDPDEVRKVATWMEYVRNLQPRILQSDLQTHQPNEVRVDRR